MDLLVARHQPRDDDDMAALDNRLRFTCEVLEGVRKRVGPDFLVGIRLSADEDWDKGLTKRGKGIEICQRLKNSGLVDFLNIIKGHIEHDAPLARSHPRLGMRASPASGLRRRSPRTDEVSGVPRRPHQRCRDRAPCHRGRKARHGGHDPRPHRRPAYREEDRGKAASRRSAPASAPPIASTASTRAMRRCASTTRRPAARPPCRMSSHAADSRSRW
jgi:hypothetical protein